MSSTDPYLVVLGTAQDGGVPQAGSFSDPGCAQPPLLRRLVACLGLVDPASQQRWMFDCTPDFPEQLRRLGVSAMSGVFLTHAHIGHYTGLMYFGREAMGTRDVPVYVMPRMKRFLESNAPWEQLVRNRNIELRPLHHGQSLNLSNGLAVTPLLVPHRDEYSETVGYRIGGPRRSVLFIPDIDAWEKWDAMGTQIEHALRDVDVAYLDGTFFSAEELPARDMSAVPHPPITHTMHRLSSLPASERVKVRFIHLNHTNPALKRDSDARRAIEKDGFRVAEEMERTAL